MYIRTALLLAVLIFGSQGAIAADVVADLHCKVSGGETTAHHSAEGRTTAQAGFWSDSIDVKIERSAAFVTWGHDTVPVRKIARFRRSKILVEAIEPIDNWKWWIEFSNPGRFEATVASLDAWHISENGRGDLYFHGGGSCYVQVRCEINSLQPACIESKPLPELP